jgi:hypothetical protein
MFALSVVPLHSDAAVLNRIQNQKQDIDKRNSKLKKIYLISEVRSFSHMAEQPDFNHTRQHLYSGHDLINEPVP